MENFFSLFCTTTNMRAISLAAIERSKQDVKICERVNQKAMSKMGCARAERCCTKAALAFEAN